MIIDSHVHTGESLFRQSLSVETLFAGMDSAGIDRAVLVPFKPPEYLMSRANDLIADTVNKNPRRFSGLGRIDPWREDALSELERIFDVLKLSGLFLHPLEECFPLTSPILRPIMEMMDKIGKPVMISGGHGRFSHPRQIEYLAGEYPGITFIATSGGQINICGQLMWDAEEMFKKCPNVILETSGIYRRDFIEHMTEVIGAGRILFGSGAPYFQQDYEQQRITTAKISNEQKELILSRNTLKLFSDNS